MTETTALALIKSVMDAQEDMVVIFKDDKPIMTNKAFNKFFSISCVDEYGDSFGPFVDNFVPHPSYFHKEKMAVGESWFDAVLKLSEMDRIVSMVTPSFEPHAFFVLIEQNVPKYTIVTLTDITQSLIKRIMIENHSNMDVKSGAYSKDYFLHISRSYQDAALFNEKLIGAILITLSNKNKSSVSDDKQALVELVSHFKNITREDDMIIRWSENKFLLIYLTDSKDKADRMIHKLESIVYPKEIKDFKSHFSLKVQKSGESIKELIKRIDTK